MAQLKCYRFVDAFPDGHAEFAATVVAFKRAVEHLGTTIARCDWNGRLSRRRQQFTLSCSLLSAGIHVPSQVASPAYSAGSIEAVSAASSGRNGSSGGPSFGTAREAILALGLTSDLSRRQTAVDASLAGGQAVLSQSTIGDDKISRRITLLHVAFVGSSTLAVTYSEAMNDAQSMGNRLRAGTGSATSFAMGPSIFVVYVAAQATVFACEPLQQQVTYAGLLTKILIQPPRKVDHAAPDVDRERVADQTARVPLTENILAVARERCATETVLAEVHITGAEQSRAGVRHAAPNATANVEKPGITVEKPGITDEVIRERAYALWEAAGRPEGRPLDTWTEAEREIYAPSASAAA